MTRGSTGRRSCCREIRAHVRAPATGLTFWVWMASLASPALAGPAEDAYVAGYVTAVLERQMDVKGSKITVKDGVVTVETAGLPGQRPREDRRDALDDRGRDGRCWSWSCRQPPATAPPATSPLPTTAATPSGPAVEAEVPRRGVELLPKGLLFAPADRRSAMAALLRRVPAVPRRCAAAQRGDRQPRRDDLARARAAGGEGRGLGSRHPGRRLQPLRPRRAVDRPRQLRLPRGLPVRVPDRATSRRWRGYFHQSSHLGDEFLIENRVERVNLSYEAVDLRLSYEVTDWLRVYGGGGYIVRGDPDDLKPWSTQMGVEVRTPHAYFGGTLRPIAAVDVQYREQNDWHADLSVRAGVQLEKLSVFDRKIQLPGGVLQRLLAERAVLPGQGRVHRARHPPLPVLRRLSRQPVERAGRRPRGTGAAGVARPPDGRRECRGAASRRGAGARARTAGRPGRTPTG